MRAFFEQMMMNKLKSLTPKELLKYASTYEIPITEKQAKQIVQFLKTNKLNPAKEKDRKLMLKQLANITDKQTALKAERLFQKLIKQYGVEDWFK